MQADNNERSTWMSMHQRCYNSRYHGFAAYGGRGIRVCARWHKSNPNGFRNFVADMGKRPDGTSIDRLDNDGDYEPSNCRWGTPDQQRSNKRPRKQWNKYHRPGKGALLTLDELARALGETPRTIRNWRAKKLIPYFALGHRTLRFRLNSVLAALEKRQIKGR